MRIHPTQHANRTGTAVLVALAGTMLAGCGSDVDLGPVANLHAATEIRTALASATDATARGQAAASTGTGWATIRGRFVYDGTPPQMQPYNATKDMATCSPDGSTPLQETLVVDSGNGGIRDVAIYLRDASRVHESAQPAGGTVEFDQKVCVFLSHVCPVTVGQTLEIINSDPVGHNTNISGRANRFNQTIPAGESIAYAVQREEAMPAPVNCSIHPWMVAYLLPRENGYYAVSEPDGSFEIAKVPADEEVEFQVWHESAEGPGGGLIVDTPEAQQLDWSNKGRFTVTLEPDEVREIEIVVPASSFSI